MLVKDETTGKLRVPQHHIDYYIKDRLDTHGWKSKDLVDISGLSKGEISKLASGQRSALSARIFFLLYMAFNDTCEDAQKIVYPDLDLSLNIVQEKPRNPFGLHMKSYEEIKNTIEIISVKTGIQLSRMRDLYYKTGAPEAYEIILIEKAVGQKPGEIFRQIYGK